MKICYVLEVCAMCLLKTFSLFGQNCFLEDFVPMLAVIPPHGDSLKTTQTPNVPITINLNAYTKYQNIFAGKGLCGDKEYSAGQIKKWSAAY